MSGYGSRKRGGGFDHYDNGRSYKQARSDYPRQVHTRPQNYNHTPPRSEHPTHKQNIHHVPTGPRHNGNNDQSWNKQPPNERHTVSAYFKCVDRLPDPNKCEPCKLAREEVDAGLIALLAKVEAEELRPDGDTDILRSAGELRRLLSSRNSKRQAQRAEELDKARPGKDGHGMVPEYIEHKMELAKDLPPLPPILEPSLQQQVFTHSSVLDPKDRFKGIISTDHLSYERLEYIGDAYLELVATRMIAYRLPHIDVPAQALLREQLVRNDTLSAFSIAYSLPDRLKHAGHVKEGGKIWGKITADIFEAYVAAVILSDPVCGFETAEKWLNALWTPKILSYKESIIENPMAREDLEKLVGMNDISLNYVAERDMRMSAIAEQVYSIGVYLTGWGFENEWLGSGEGRSKHQACVNAAQDAIHRNNDALQTATRKKKEFIAAMEAEREQVREQAREELRNQAKDGNEEAISKLRKMLAKDIRVKKKLADKGDVTVAEKLKELIAEEAKLGERANDNASKGSRDQDVSKSADKIKVNGSASIPDSAAKKHGGTPSRDKKDTSFKKEEPGHEKGTKKGSDDFLASIAAGNVDALSAKEHTKDGSSWLEREQKKKEKEERKKQEKMARK